MKSAQHLRSQITDGKIALGTFVIELKSEAVPIILKRTGFDFFMIDAEHGFMDPHEISQLIAAGKKESICPIVRVSSPHRSIVTPIIDAGAEGILVPMIRTMDDVQMAVQSTKYPPLGQRGAHFLRPACDFNPPDDMYAVCQSINRRSITALQVETVESIDIIDQMAATPGVDVLYVGPGDLSITMGSGKGLDDPAVMSVVEKVCIACQKHGKIAGCHVDIPARVTDLVRLGVQMVGMTAALKIFWEGTADYVERTRESIARGQV